MKRYEKESLAKNFIIFFSLEMILLVALFIQNYHQELHSRLDILENEMKLCSYSLDCPKYNLDFVSKNSKIETDILYKDTTLTSYFNVPTVKNYLLKIYLPKSKYQKLKEDIRDSVIEKFIIYALFIAVISFLLSLYTLWPLKKALRLNDEFIKDVLHDINTPLSSMVINFKLLKREFGNNRKIERVESGIETILSMQNNLRAFLDSSKLQKEELNLKEIIEDRVDYFKKQYPNIKFISNIDNLTYKTNKDAFIRIIDNIISNGAKYNRENGFVKVTLKDNLLIIEDSGVGIKDVKRVFQRYYKENERGIGIGMNIVKKLCDALGIKISIVSKINIGTRVNLKLR